MTAVFGAIGCLAEPFMDFSCFRKLRTKHQMTKTGYVLIGLICAIPLLGIVIVLLYQADAVFAHALSGMFSFDVPISRVIGIVFMFAYALFAAYCGIRYLGKGTISAQSKDLRKLEPMSLSRSYKSWNPLNKRLPRLFLLLCYYFATNSNYSFFIVFICWL